MSSPVTRYRPSRRYLVYAILCGFGAAGSAWAGLQWGAAWIAAVLSFLAGGFAMIALTLRPAIEVHHAYLAVGRHIVFWNEIQRVDRTRWFSPLVVRLIVAGHRRIYVLYPGDQDSSMDLLRNLFRNSREALLDGVPYSEFWGDSGVASGLASHEELAISCKPAARPPAPLGRLLLPEDEAEVERLFQRLKTAGRLDQRGSNDE